MKPDRFDPVRHHTSKATDDELRAYLHDRLGLSLATIQSITLMLGCDGAAHEVWEELVARRRRTGS